MNLRSSLLLATLTLSSSVFGQDYYQVGYAANLNIGDSVVNITNSGAQGGVFGATPATVGNICVNAYVFDPQEEEIGCCSCLVTPNALNSLSAKSDLTSNNLTPGVPTSIVIKLVASQPGQDISGAYKVCDPTTVGIGHSPPAFPTLVGVIATVPYTPDGFSNAAGGMNSPAVASAGAVNTGSLAAGMVAWGSTLEPNVATGTYGVVSVPFLTATLLRSPLGTYGTGLWSGVLPTSPLWVGSELPDLTSVCNFIKANGTGFGICKSCRLGALGSAKK